MRARRGRGQFGMHIRTFEHDGQVQVCYDGELYGRVPSRSFRLDDLALVRQASTQELLMDFGGMEGPALAAGSPLPALRGASDHASLPHLGRWLWRWSSVQDASGGAGRWLYYGRP